LLRDRCVRTAQRIHHRFRISALAILALLLAGARASGAPQSASLVWRSLSAPVRGGEIAALAFDPASGTLALGDLRGVLVGPPEGPFQRRLRRGGVRDLVFLRDASGLSLLVATARGLFLIEPDGRVVEVSPGPGAAGRTASRLAVAADWIAVASDDGVFLSRDARRWLRPATAFPAGPATAVALRARAGALECWTVIEGEPWSARILENGQGLAARESLRQTVSFAAADGGPVDLVLDPPGADVAVVYPTALALRDTPAGAWRVVRFELPPGAEALRLAAGAGGFFLATLRGLLVAESLEGPWRRAGPPAGSAAVRALAGAPAVVFAAADAGLLAGAAPAPRAAAASPGAPPAEMPEEPPIERVHRAALAHQRIGRHGMDALQRGVSKRGWLPIVTLRGGLARDKSRATAWDQTVSGGAVWSLVDRDRDSAKDYGVDVALAWDLGDVAYHPEAIDVSREAREVIELRDDVLDEITQLYFERRRVIAQLQALPDADELERLRLRLRADELAAGIDAWTGGWFGRHTSRLAEQPLSSPRIGGN
jgi:hypothetical protein